LVQKINMIELVSPDPAIIQAQPARAHKANQPQFVFSLRWAPISQSDEAASKFKSWDARLGGVQRHPILPVHMPRSRWLQS
jgi:hypothetical protein